MRLGNLPARIDQLRQAPLVQRMAQTRTGRALGDLYRSLLGELPETPPAPAVTAPVAMPQSTAILDVYLHARPQPQTVLDVFDGEWSSKLPERYGLTTRPGVSALFEDGRITWLEDLIGSFDGLDVLELGPLEGGHTYMLHDGGARRVVAVEANSRAFLKCLCIKEVLKLSRAEFLLGDCVEYLRGCEERFDLVVASGILYHMSDPAELLTHLGRVAQRMLLWTHYYDGALISARPELARKFGPPETATVGGITIETAQQTYLEALNWGGFNGGSRPNSRWMTRDSILGMLKGLGYTRIEINFEHLDHPAGPAFAVYAER